MDANSMPSPQIAKISQSLRVVEADKLGATLKPLLQPDFQVAGNQSAIGVVHRKLDSADLYFVVNTSNQAIHTKATVRVTGHQPQWWDPMSGQVYRADGLAVDLAPYESRILVFADEPGANAPALPGAAQSTQLDLTQDWSLTLAGRNAPPIHMDKLHSWADDPALKFYSGEMNYRKTIDVPASFLQGKQVVLDFGEGTTVPDPHAHNGTRALLESPVREAAVVNINGQTAGTVWHPPYQLDVTKLLHAGKNEIHIVVGNLALNEMAGETMPTYKLLNLRYGERFQAQDMDQVQPMPSGITGPLRLVCR